MRRVEKDNKILNFCETTSRQFVSDLMRSKNMASPFAANPLAGLGGFKDLLGAQMTSLSTVAGKNDSQSASIAATLACMRGVE